MAQNIAQTELTYFISTGDYVKVGKTNNLKGRLEHLQHANPHELEVLGVTFTRESDIHEKFVHLRERGEWFHLTTELRKYISENASCPDKDGKYEDIEGVDPETGRKDFDVIAVGKSREQQGRIKSVRDIIQELEREAGSASIAKIIERAEKLGFDKDKVEAEITKLVQEAAIFAPVRYSENYRLTQQ
jgi:hypothetical protein